MNLRRIITTVAMALALSSGARAQEANADPQSILPISLLEISSIELEGTNVVVTVQVSANFKRVTLESRSRLGGGAWEPRAVERPGTFSTPVKVLTFRLPFTEKMELIRVRGDESEELPDSFFQGETKFATPGAAGGPEILRTTTFNGAPNAAVDAAAEGATQREVVESDIWNVNGDTLFFFNQYRGLQVIDISNSSQPKVRASYNLPAAGEQMYVVDDNHVVLLARDHCNGWGAASESRVILIEVSGDQTRAVAELAVPGHIRESRMVGTALYIASETYQPIRITVDGKEPQDTWEWGSQISSFDLADFNNPVARGTQWLAGYGNAIHATDRFLFIAAPQTGNNSWRSESVVHIFDISSPNGAMSKVSKLSARGWIKDKFKMNLNGDTFTAVTENWSDNSTTRVETFSLADPAAPVALGNLIIIEREQLHATRFAGNLLYAVTFMRVDPLWIIDLSNPAQPKKVGELEIPGWSTYIHPLGDRLLTIGIDNTDGWRTSVQLFDVRDPAKPGLLSKILLGERHSSSEATQDEKAFGVLPDQNLALVPYSTWENGTQFDAVQLIDLEPDSLRKRGLIEHSFQARRATVHDDRILSLSGTELLSVDATDRDQPRVVSSTELAWPVDRVFIAGDHLIEISAPYNDSPSVRVVSRADTDQALAQVQLSNLPLLGAEVDGQQLYVLQGRSTEVLWPPIWNPTNYFPIGTNKAALKLTVFNLGSLPQLVSAGSVEQEFDTRYWNNFKALFPKPGLLVWGPGTGSRYWGGPFFAVDMAVGVTASLAPVSRGIWWPGWGGAAGNFVAFDVQNTSAPKLVSETQLQGTNNWWSFSEAHTANGLVYVSHQTSEFDQTITPPPQILRTYDGTRETLVTNIQPPGVWVQKYYLDVIDYADPADPAVRRPVNIPGSLIGLGRNGALLFTLGSTYANPFTWEGWTETVDASAYDGVAAHRVDSIPMPAEWPHPILVRQGKVFLGRPAPKSDQQSHLEVWDLPDSGKFAKIGQSALKAPAGEIKAFDELLAVTAADQIHLFDATNPAALIPLGSGQVELCLGYNLEYADGSVNRGLWIPLGFYGVQAILPGAGEVPAAE